MVFFVSFLCVFRNHVRDLPIVDVIGDLFVPSYCLCSTLSHLKSHAGDIEFNRFPIPRSSFSSSLRSPGDTLIPSLLPTLFHCNGHFIRIPSSKPVTEELKLLKYIFISPILYAVFDGVSGLWDRGWCAFALVTTLCTRANSLVDVIIFSLCHGLIVLICILSNVCFGEQQGGDGLWGTTTNDLVTLTYLGAVLPLKIKSQGPGTYPTSDSRVTEEICPAYSRKYCEDTRVHTSMIFGHRADVTDGQLP